MNPGRFKFIPCGSPKHKKKHSSTELQNRAQFNSQQGKRPLCVPSCIASALKHGQDHYGCNEFLKQGSSFLKETKHVPRSIEILCSKLKYKVKVSKNVFFDGVDPSGPDLVLLVLRGTDDYTGHSVCLMRGLVFDASNKSGVIFNIHNLDL
jgi:hypothetical protein